MQSPVVAIGELDYICCKPNLDSHSFTAKSFDHGVFTQLSGEVTQ